MKNKDISKISEHNHRESVDGQYSNPNINSERTHLNVRHSEFPEEEKLKVLIDNRIEERKDKKKKIRKDAVKMISVLVTASPEYINGLSCEEQLRYFDDQIMEAYRKNNNKKRYRNLSAIPPQRRKGLLQGR